MPTRPAGPCGQPGCRELRPCPTHARKPWTPTGRAPARLRGRAHGAARRRVITRDGPLCRRCRLIPGVILDHIAELADWRLGDPDPNRDENLQMLCDACNAAKTAEAAEARRHR